MLSSEQHRVLYIDLSSKKSEVKVHSNYFQSIGGVSLAASLYYDLIEQNPIVFSIGPLTGLLPFASNTCCVFRSPLTGGMGESYCAGWFGAVVRFANLDAIVITGSSAHPVYIDIRGDAVNFHDATSLWGTGTFDATESLLETEGLAGKRTALVIGPAGEKGLVYSKAVVDRIYGFSRLGLGARLGGSLLKGLVISGTSSLELPDVSGFKEVHTEILRNFSQAENDFLYPNFRVSGNLAGFDEERSVGGIPNNNLLSNRFDFPLSEKEILIKTSAMPVASFGCPLPDLYVVRRGNRLVPLEYDAFVGLGSLLGCNTLEDILDLMDISLQEGLDPVPLGWVLAHIMETRGLSFGHADSYKTLVSSLVSQTEEWARQSQNNPELVWMNGVEMVPYFNGYATVLSQLISFTGNIRDSEGDRLDLSLRGSPFEDEKLVEHLWQKTVMSALLNSLIVDYPARSLYADESLLFSILKVLGYSFTRADLEILPEKLFKLRKDIAQYHHQEILNSPRLPARLFTTPSAYGLLKEERLKSMIALFKEKYWLNQ